MTPLANVNIVAAAMFATSAGLLAYCSIALARRFGATPADRYWMAIAAAVTQLATIAVALSPTRSLTPIGFLLVQLFITAVLAWTIGLRPVNRTAWPGVRAAFHGSRRRLLLFAIALFLALGLWMTAAMPIHTFDDRMYRASRVAYWLQHRSVLPWTTHNDRQTAFPFGSELLFFWPVLFTRAELPGRLAFFAGVPLCAIGLYTVMREARVVRTASLAGVLVLLATPTFFRLQDGLYPEVWLSVFALGALYFGLRAAGDPARAARHLLCVGFLAALAVNVKTTALALLPAALMLPWLIPAKRPRWRGVANVLAGAVAGAALSGLALTVAMNLRHDGQPLGPPGMSAAHTADQSPRQLRTHAGRFLVGLMDFPVMPIESGRRALSDIGNGFLKLLGADHPLPGEDLDSFWPGTYHFGVGLYATRFSLGGMLWLPCLAVATLLISRGGTSRGRPWILLLFAASLLLPSILVIRWMGGMDRFFLPAYAVSLPILAIVLQQAARRWRSFQSLVIVLIALAVLPVLLLENADAWRRTPLVGRELDEPFHSALRQIPAGSRILLVAAIDARDYGLFRPRDGFTNQVVPWGHQPFDAARMQRLIDENDITHVLVQNDQRLSLHWRPPLETREMVRWLSEQKWFEELPVPSPGMRLFIRRKPA
jgi:hypothetical protein